MSSIYIKAIRVLAGMIYRCTTESAAGYHRYGGRGIYVDEVWIKNPTLFVSWYVENYFEGAQVDRINNDGPYSPDNCRLATAKENSRNREITKTITAWGETKALFDWLEDPRCMVKSYSTLAKRIKDKWIAEEAISLKVDYSLSIARKEKNNKGNYRGQMPDAPRLTAFGESKTLHEWSIDPRCVVDKNTLWARKESNWDMEKAITKQPAKNAGQIYNGKSVLQWSEDPSCLVSYKKLNSRLKDGWTIEDAISIPDKNARKKYNGKTAFEWSRNPLCEVSYRVLQGRLKSGIPIEKALLKLMNNDTIAPEVENVI